MCYRVSVIAPIMSRTAVLLAAASVFALVFDAIAAPNAAQAQIPSVVYVVNGRLANRDYFGGGGTLENILPTTIGDNLSFSQTLVNPAGTSETSLAFSSNVSGNTGTFSSNFSSLVQKSWTAAPQFFIYTNISEIAVDTYVLGEPGTLYLFEVVSTGVNDSINGGEGSYSANARSAGQGYPGEAYNHPTAGGTYSEMGVSGSIIITYLSNTYSLVRPGPRGISDAFFGITGTPDSGGFTRMSASHSFTSTVTNLAVAPAVVPEPATLVLVGMGLLPVAGVAIRKRRSAKA